jgi:hypothetical protein
MGRALRASPSDGDRHQVRSRDRSPCRRSRRGPRAVRHLSRDR